MRRSKSMKPQVEGLESLVFLSAAGVANPALAERIAAARQAAILARQAPTPSPRPAQSVDLSNPDLSGSARGNYRLDLAPDGSSGTFQIQGIGQFRGLGPARVSAVYHASQSHSPDTMSVSLTTRRGGLTLQVGQDPRLTAPDSSTARLRYQIVSGTGQLAGASGTGVLDMSLRPQVRSLGTSGQMNLSITPDVS